MQTSNYSQMLQKSLAKIVLYGLPILYFLIAVSFYLKTYDSAQIKITLLHVGGFFLIAAWLVSKIENGNFDFFKNNFIFFLPILAFLLSGLISFAGSPFFYTSLNEFIRRFIYCCFAFILITEFNSEKKISLLLNWLILATYIVCIYGIIQLLDYYLFPPPPDMGLDPFAWRQAFLNRIFSTFGNPNFFGDFLIVMNPIVLALYMHKRKFYLLFLWILILLCAVFTVSKGTWLGYAAGTFLFTVVYIATFLKNKISRKTLISGVITITVILTVAFFGILTVTKKRTDSASFRLFTWLSAWEMINTNPVLGTGIGTFYVTYPSWRRPQIFFIEAKHNTESDHPENEYLEVWFDEGIIGFTIFLTLIFFVFTMGLKNITFFVSGKGTRDGPMPYIQLGVLSAFFAQLAHDTVCVSLRFVSSGVMLWLLIGITVSICVNNSKTKDTNNNKNSVLSFPVKLILQAVVICISIYAIIYFAGYFKGDYLHSRAIQYSRQSDWDTALKTYDDVGKVNPSFPMARYFQANAHLDRWKAGDPEMTERFFHKLWALAPNYVQSKFLAGVMYSRMWESVMAQRNDYYSKGKQEEADAMAKSSDELFALALKYYNEYIMIDPIYPLTYQKLAQLYAQSGDFEKAVKVLLAHIEYPANLKQHPHDFWVEDWESRRVIDYSETYSQLGNLLATYGKFEDARRAYEKSLEIFPDHFGSLKNLTIVYANLGDPEKSNEMWMEVYKRNPNDEDAKRYLQGLGKIPRDTE